MKNLFRIAGGEGGGGQKDLLLPVFHPVTSKNVGISPYNFLTFSFIFFYLFAILL